MEPWDENWVAGTDLPAIINVSGTGFYKTPAVWLRYKRSKRLQIFQQFMELAKFLKPKVILRVRPRKRTKALVAVCDDFLVVGCKPWRARFFTGPLDLKNLKTIPQGSLNAFSQ